MTSLARVHFLSVTPPCATAPEPCAPGRPTTATAVVHRSITEGTVARSSLGVATLAVVCLTVGTMPIAQAQTIQPAVTADATGAIYTTFHPTQYFAERIVDGRLPVVNPCPPDADPAFWMPDDKTIRAYQKSALIVVNGASFEKWLDKVTLPASRVVDTTRPLKGEFIRLKHAVRHSHGAGGEHTHEGIDGHTWLDPINAKVQAGEIAKALIRRFPKHKERFATNLAALESDLDKLDARLKKVSRHVAGKQLLANHPAWNYVARRYGWDVKSFHLDPEEEPDVETLEEIRAFLREHPASYMLWEAEPSEEVRKVFEGDLGLKTIVYPPAEAVEPAAAKKGQNYLTIMQANVERLERIFGASAP